jgi:hypothetical protein
MWGDATPHQVTWTLYLLVYQCLVCVQQFLNPSTLRGSRDRITTHCMPACLERGLEGNRMISKPLIDDNDLTVLMHRKLCHSKYDAVRFATLQRWHRFLFRMLMRVQQKSSCEIFLLHAIEGISIDNGLTLNNYISRLCKLSLYHLCSLHQIRPDFRTRHTSLFNVMRHLSPAAYAYRTDNRDAAATWVGSHQQVANGFCCCNCSFLKNDTKQRTYPRQIVIARIFHVRRDGAIS